MQRRAITVRCGCAGTRVQLLGTRKHDDSTDGFAKWRFMSVATWGEDPRGTWSLDILDEVSHPYTHTSPSPSRPTAISADLTKLNNKGGWGWVGQSRGCI